jgi:hypothetical protein
MTQSKEDIFKTMNATRVLVAILNKIESISIPTEDFINSNSEDVQLSVTYNDETMSFEFRLEDKPSASDEELPNN